MKRKSQLLFCHAKTQSLTILSGLRDNLLHIIFNPQNSIKV